METNCYIYHNPTTSQEYRIVAPMIAVKQYYISAYTTKKALIASKQSWIKNSTKKNAKMLGAIEKFAIIPKTPYPAETIKQIVEYIYDHDMEQPDWFKNYYNDKLGDRNRQAVMNRQKKRQSQTLSKDLSYDQRGLEYALNTKAVLVQNLMDTMQRKDVLEALSFYNKQAYSLTNK